MNSTEDVLSFRKRNQAAVTFFVLILVLLTAILFRYNKPIRSYLTRASEIDDTPVTKKIFLLIFNPVLENQGGVTLTQYMHWSDPDAITTQLLQTFPLVSNGYINYTIQERQQVDGYYKKQSGYEFSDASYIDCLQRTGPCSGELIDYQKLFTDYNVCSKNVDEVWIWGGPWFGYLEYNPVPYCGKTHFVMGFNYERLFDEAIHNFGHRMEFVAIRRIGNGNWQQNESNDWNKFSLINGHCGNVHYPPGSTVPTDEYIYNKTTPISSDCDGFLNYPSGPYSSQSITCSAWGCTQGGYISWWLRHIPHATGINTTTTDGKIVYNNWWKYYANFDETATPIPTPSLPPGVSATPTPIPTFTSLSSTLVPGRATFNFSYSGSTTMYTIDMSILSDMSSGTYLTFAQGSSSPLVVTNPEKWDQYVCGKNFYWRVKTASGTQSSIQSAVVTCPVITLTPTPIPTFTSLSSTLVPGRATFNFSYSGSTTMYTIDMSILSDMSSGTYLTFAQGSSSPLVVTNPEKWDQYVCGKNFYWRVKTASGTQSLIQSASVSCPTPTFTPTPTRLPTPTATNTPTPSPTNTPTPTPVSCNKADINKDGNVDYSDYTLVLNNYFLTNPTNPRADINADGIIDLTDYSLLVVNYNVSTGVCQ